MELLNLRNRTLRYHSHPDFERILVSGIVKNFLEEKWKNMLFDYISEIKVTEKNINIHMTKPIAKSEIMFLKEEMDKKITEKMSEMYDSYERKIKIL